MPNPNELKQKIEQNLPGSFAEIIDLRNDGMHFKAIVESPSFGGKTRIEQHRMVYDSLKEEFKNGLHSLSIEIKSEGTPLRIAPENKNRNFL